MDENIPNEKRKHERIEYFSIVHCFKMIYEDKIMTFDPPVEMDMKNIAPEGLCISSQELFEVSSVLKLDIILEDIPYQGLTGTIIWRIKNNNSYDYGLHLHNITGKLAVHIIEIERKLSNKI